MVRIRGSMSRLNQCEHLVVRDCTGLVQDVTTGGAGERVRGTSPNGCLQSQYLKIKSLI